MRMGPNDTALYDARPSSLPASHLKLAPANTTAKLGSDENIGLYDAIWEEVRLCPKRIAQQMTLSNNEPSLKT